MPVPAEAQAIMIPPARATPSLPTELARNIILEAWISASETSSRWGTFNSMCIVSKAWHALAIEAVFKFVLLRDVHEGERYEQFAQTYGSSYANNGGDNTASYISPFSNSDVYLYLGGRHLFCVSERPAVFEHKYTGAYGIDLARLLPDARSMQLFVPNNHLWPHVLCNTHRPSLKHLHIWYDHDSYPVGCMPRRRTDEPWVLPHAIPSVTHFHISRAPVKLNEVLRWFPNVAHLRVSTYVDLLAIVPVAKNVVTLTIDIPPTTLDGTAYASLFTWTFRAALRDGLLSQGDAQVGKTIIVNTGGGDNPTGWESAEALCAAHGIRMVRNIIYDVPPPPWIDATWDQIFYGSQRGSIFRRSSRLPPIIIS